MNGNVVIRSNGEKVCGSQVLVDGVPMKGVTKVEIVGDPQDGLWRAVLHVLPSEVDISAIDSKVREFAKVA